MHAPKYARIHFVCFFFNLKTECKIGEIRKIRLSAGFSLLNTIFHPASTRYPFDSLIFQIIMELPGCLTYTLGEMYSFSCWCRNFILAPTIAFSSTLVGRNFISAPNVLFFSLTLVGRSFILAQNSFFLPH